jgi:hypothetical protein
MVGAGTLFIETKLWSMTFDQKGNLKLVSRRMGLKNVYFASQLASSFLNGLASLSG